MTEVVYTGPHGAVVLPNGVTLTEGEPVWVEDEIAEALARQGDFTINAQEEDEDS